MCVLLVPEASFVIAVSKAVQCLNKCRSQDAVLSACVVSEAVKGSPIANALAHAVIDSVELVFWEVCPGFAIRKQ